MDDHRFAPDGPRDDAPSVHPLRRTPWNTVGGRVISLVSRKGGVGKTTSAVNLGAALALGGHSVLIIGVDPQCGVCRSLGSRPLELPRCLSEIFTAGTHLSDVAQPSDLAELFFASPRILSLDDEEHFLAAMESRPMDFVQAVDRARSLYDTVLIDCPPSLGPATRAALLASDGYLVPVQAEELCRESLDSLLQFVDTFRDRNFAVAAADELPASPLALEGLFLTMENQRTRVGRHVGGLVREEFGGFLFDTAIPRTVRLAEMALHGRPTVIHDRRSAGSRAYFDLADELIARYCLETEEASGPRPALREEPEERSERLAGGGLESFLRDLAGDRIGTPAAPQAPAQPEMVSLDDLLAEEESGNGDWDEDGWSRDLDVDRMN